MLNFNSKMCSAHDGVELKCLIFYSNLEIQNLNIKF